MLIVYQSTQEMLHSVPSLRQLYGKSGWKTSYNFTKTAGGKNKSHLYNKNYTQGTTRKKQTEKLKPNPPKQNKKTHHKTPNQNNADFE